jgi:two-component system, LuxR family, response regulator FixJ
MVAGKMVLVVEDDEGMREALIRLLDAAGFRTAAFVSAEALLDVGASSDAVCVVSDLKLPGMSGLEMLAEFHHQEGWPPLILVTAHDGPGLREEATRRGVAAYLLKPFQAAELLEAIEKASRAIPA